MGKKNKKEKKESGSEKTARKSEKRMDKKLKKTRMDAGEDDIEVLISKFKEEDRRKTEVIEKKCDPPSPRINFSFTGNRVREEIYLFGGEYDNGSKTAMFNDFFVYSCKKNEWKKIETGNSPPPRSSHQAVLVRSGHGDQLWIFGGEFVSPTETQFYHYRDLWLWHFKERRWEQVKTSSGPQSRSGHRMVLWRKSLFLFGGFNDTGKSCKYFNDLWQFDLSTRRWIEMLPARGGAPPAARSASLLLPTQDGKALYILGGFSRSAGQKKGSDEQGTVYADLYHVSCSADRVKGDEEVGASAEGGVWNEVKWRSVRWCGARPDPVRTGMAAVVGDGVPGGAALVFGGVHDDYSDPETVCSRFFRDLFRLDLENGRWTNLEYRKPKTDEEMGEEMEGLKIEEKREEEEEEEKEVVTEDGVFTLKVGGRAEEKMQTDAVGEDPYEVANVPSSRMNCGAAVIGHRLIIYGGQVETEKKTRILDDLHQLDLHKMDSWQCLHRGTDTGWVGEESSDSESEMDDEDDEDLLLNAPAPTEGESFTAYWERTQAVWCDLIASHMLDSDDEEEMFNPDSIRSFAMKTAKGFHKDFSSQRR